LACAVYAAYSLRARKSLLSMLLALALTGPCCAWVASLKSPMFYHRTLLWCPLPWFVLIGLGVASLPRRAALPAACVVLLAALPQLREYYAVEVKPAWRRLLGELVAETDERSVILSARAERFMIYYFERKSQ